MKKLKHHIKYWFPVYIYAIFIFFLSNLSNPPAEEIILGTTYSFSNYIKHFILFSLFSILLYRASYNYNFKNPFLFTIIIAVLYAITDEIHQIFVPNRHFSFLDLLADSLGILITQYITKLKFRYSLN